MESVSPEHSRRDEVIKFDLYQHEAVPNCILVYPDGTKVDGFVDESYRKVDDFQTTPMPSGSANPSSR